MLEDTTLIDWPLTLEELAPYYEQAESKMGVSGTHDMPPSFETSNYKVLRAGARRIGYKEITSARTAINSVPRDGRPACQQIDSCWAGCAIGAKWSTLYTEIPKAEQTGHFELRTGAMAVRIEHDDAGQVRSVVYAAAPGSRASSSTSSVTTRSGTLPAATSSRLALISLTASSR